MPGLLDNSLGMGRLRMSAWNDKLNHRLKNFKSPQRINAEAPGPGKRDDDTKLNERTDWIPIRRNPVKGEYLSNSLWAELGSQDIYAQKMKGRKKCHLLNLPYELLQEIIDLAYDNPVLHVVDMDDKMGQIRCNKRWPQKTLEDEERVCSRTCQSPLWHFVSYRAVPSFEYSSGVPAIARTCRQLYSHGIDVLYSRSTFEFEYPETFIRLHSTLRSDYFAAIKRLRISGHARAIRTRQGIEKGWDEMWEIICHKMTLIDLQVCLYIQLETRSMQAPRWSDECQTLLKVWLAKPIRYLRQMRHFDLAIHACVSDHRLEAFSQNLKSLVCSSAAKGEDAKFCELLESDTGNAVLAIS